MDRAGALIYIFLDFMHFFESCMKHIYFLIRRVVICAFGDMASKK